MTRRIPFNLNEYVWVTLTPEGVEILKEQWRKGDRLHRPEDNMDAFYRGWRTGLPIKMQAWVAFQIFGPLVKMGRANPIKPDIEFEVEE